MYQLARRHWPAVAALSQAAHCCGGLQLVQLPPAPPRRRVSTSRPRPFLQSYLSSRITERERIAEADRQRERTRRIEDLTSQATGVAGRPPAPAATTPEETFSPEALAEKRLRRQEFFDTIFLYLERYGRTRRGHVDFIEASVRRMRELGVHDDLEAYRALMDVFPKDLMRVRSMWQSEFKHYPRQQDAALLLLDTMNEHHVMPDTEMAVQISRIFGTESYVMAKYQRMMYWLPKLRHSDPWPVATLTSSGLRYHSEPDSPRSLAVCALRRMCPDPETRFATYDMEGSGAPFVASAQAPTQQELLASLGPGATVYVDGPSLVWYGKHRLKYYVLSADPTPLAREHAARAKAAAAANAKVPQPARPRFEEEDYAWWRELRCHGEAAPDTALARSPSEHELPEATLLALAIASSSGAADLLLRWIRLLGAEPGNEGLQRVGVVFRIRDEEAEAETAEATRRLGDAAA